MSRGHGFHGLRLGSAPLLAIFLAACGGAEAAKLAVARIDTLPGGIVRVMSEGPTAWSDSAGMALVEEARFQGEDGTPAELGQPRSLAVDELGRIYVVDANPAAIKVFTPDGQLIRTLGREGEGPGEFRIGFIAVRHGFLALHDPRLSRTSLWDTAGTFVRSWRSSCCYWTDIQIDRNLLIYVPTPLPPSDPKAPPRGQPYVRWSLEGTAVDTVWIPRRESAKVWTVTVSQGGKNMSRMSTSVPFLPSLASTLHPDGGILYGWTGDYAIVRSALGPDSVLVFGRAFQPETVTDAERKAEVESRIKQAGESWGEENIRRAFKLEDVPTTLPTFMNLRVDGSGRVWARRFSVRDTTRSFFDVFDSTGAYLGLVTVPVRINEWSLQAWTRDGLVTVIEDDEGRPTVVRFNLGIRGTGK